MTKEEANQRSKKKNGAKRPPQKTKSEETIVINYLTKIMNNLGINAINNADELPEELWEDMFTNERMYKHNVSKVAQERRFRAEKLRKERASSKRGNNNKNGRGKGKGKDQKSENEPTEEEEQPHTELLKLEPAGGLMDWIEPGSTSLFHDKFPYFYKDLLKIPLKSNPELNNNIHSYLSKLATKHTKFMNDTNRNEIETLKYIQHRRSAPNLPIDDTKDNEHPLHSNSTLFKLITSRNDDVNAEEVPPRIEAQAEFWRYIEKTVLTISRQNAILFAIDIEGFESNQNIITEIGISIFDPRENRPEDGVTVPILRNYHLVVSEFFTMRNKSYLNDVKDCYLLGESLVLPYETCGDFIQSLLNFYMFPKSDEEKTWGRCFVGHGMANDLTWLRSMGMKFPKNMKDISFRYRPGETDDTTYIIDTGKLHQIMYGDAYGALGKNLKLYNIPHAYMHNAGNDAYYTLQLIMNIGNFKFREMHHLDDLRYMAKKIHRLQRDDDRAMGKNVDPKAMSLPGGTYKYNIPMTDIAAVIEFIKMNNQPEQLPVKTPKRKSNNRRDGDIRKRRENLLGVTQFHGMRWKHTVIDSFLAVDEFPYELDE